MRTYTMFNPRSFLYKFVLILFSVQILSQGLIVLLTGIFVHEPNIPKYRIVCSIAEILVFTAFVIFLKPSAKDLGISLADMKKSSKIIYLAGGVLILALVISSYFIMIDRRYFALITNIHFGITIPIFEELIFRGYGWEKFRREGRSNWVTLITTSVVFGLFHLGYYYQIAYATRFHPEAPSMANIMLTKVIFGTVLGFIMGLIRWKSKRTFGPIILHSILNILGE